MVVCYVDRLLVICKIRQFGCSKIAKYSSLGSLDKQNRAVKSSA